jgi:hypothetical protein
MATSSSNLLQLLSTKRKLNDGDQESAPVKAAKAKEPDLRTSLAKVPWSKKKQHRVFQIKQHPNKKWATVEMALGGSTYPFMTAPLIMGSHTLQEKTSREMDSKCKLFVLWFVIILYCTDPARLQQKSTCTPANTSV